jgi:hypothetical protein
MPLPVTIQIQLEPDLGLDEEQLKRCRSAMFDACFKIECLGFVRCEMFLGEEKYEPKN